MSPKMSLFFYDEYPIMLANQFIRPLQKNRNQMAENNHLHSSQICKFQTLPFL